MNERYVVDENGEHIAILLDIEEGERRITAFITSADDSCRSFDWDEPPMFKNFLRIDASDKEVRIGCFAATGCAEH
jgi:hypothetical protein